MAMVMCMSHLSVKCSVSPYPHRRRGRRVHSSSEPSLTTSEQPPSIDLEFIGPKPGPGGDEQIQKLSVVSGEKVLRKAMLENKIELYAAYGKVMNCGGGGSCGTCLVEILQGEDLLSDHTGSEQRYLKKKPSNWRLACQTIVGNKENNGKVVIQRLPQWKEK